MPKYPKYILPLAVVLVTALVGAGLFVSGGGLRLLNTPSATSYKLPHGCAKPPDGFLFVTTSEGWNDSLEHGVPLYPIVSVLEGQNVTIVVCNVDNQAHGFQIDHYYDSSIVSEDPGQVITVNFIA